MVVFAPSLVWATLASFVSCSPEHRFLLETDEYIQCQGFRPRSKRKQHLKKRIELCKYECTVHQCKYNSACKFGLLSISNQHRLMKPKTVYTYPLCWFMSKLRLQNLFSSLSSMFYAIKWKVGNSATFVGMQAAYSFLLNVWMSSSKMTIWKEGDWAKRLSFLYRSCLIVFWNVASPMGGRRRIGFWAQRQRAGCNTRGGCRAEPEVGAGVEHTSSRVHCLWAVVEEAVRYSGAT